LVKQELLDVYEKLDTRRKLYDKATRLGNSFIAVGSLLFLLSGIPLIPLIISELLSRLWEIPFNISFRLLWPGCTLIGFILAMIGVKLNKRTPAPVKLSMDEEAFLKVVESLKDLDTYLEQNIEFSKAEAVKKLSGVERDLYESTTSSRGLWEALSKDRNEALRLLKRDLKEKLLPAINQGGREEIKKAYSIIEKFAWYLLNPTTSALGELNESMAQLPTHVEEKPSIIPFFERHPKIRHVSFELLFALIGFIAYYMGNKFLNISIEHLYYLAWIIWATLTASYMAIIMRRR
jgi:hypothetical protein